MQIRDRLLAAAETEFAAKGAIDARLADIRQSAQVSVGALYHHFPDKSALYLQVWQQALDDYQEDFWNQLRAGGDAERGVRAVVTGHLRWVEDHPAKARILAMQRPAGLVNSAEFIRNVLGWWHTHETYGSVGSFDADILYALWLGPAQELSRLWLAGEITTTPTAAAATLADAAWHTLRRKP